MQLSPEICRLTGGRGGTAKSANIASNTWQMMMENHERQSCGINFDDDEEIILEQQMCHMSIPKRHPQANILKVVDMLRQIMDCVCPFVF